MRSLAWLLFIPLAVAGALGTARRASAPCTSSASTCVNCHEVQGLRPVLTDAQPWHEDHSFADLCASCHRGDPTAESAAAAHAGMCAPLDAPDVTCAGCHGDAGERAGRYRTFLVEHPPPAPPPAGAAPAIASHAPRRATADRVLAVTAVALAAVLALLITRPRTRLELGRWLRAGRWSPYVAGAGLGLLVAIAEVGFGRPLAAAGAFDRLAAYPGRALFPTSPYYAYAMKPQIVTTGQFGYQFHRHHRGPGTHPAEASSTDRRRGRGSPKATSAASLPSTEPRTVRPRRPGWVPHRR